MARFYRPFFSSKVKWRYLVSGRSKLLPALRELGQDTLAMIGRRSTHHTYSLPSRHFVREMLEGLRKFDKNVLIILSEDDLTASEFTALVSRDIEWKKVIERPTIFLRTVKMADHTFSRKAWKDEVSRVTIDWINSNCIRK